MAEMTRWDTLQAKIAQTVALLEEAQASLNAVGQQMATAGSLPPDLQRVATSTLRHCDMLQADFKELAELIQKLSSD